MDTKIAFLFLFFLSLLAACSVKKTASVSENIRRPDCGLPVYVSENEMNNRDLNRLVVYKTRKDYSNLVPIQLSQDKQTIISYPAKEDLVRVGNKNAQKLENGFLIDLIGVTQNTVFTNFDLDQYQQVATPTIEEFKKNIIELDPFIEMYQCERKFTQNEINKFIIDNTISEKCLKIK